MLECCNFWWQTGEKIALQRQVFQLVEFADSAAGGIVAFVQFQQGQFLQTADFSGQGIEAVIAQE